MAYQLELLNRISQAKGKRIEDLNDHELLWRFVENRDQSAFEQLYRRHEQMVYHRCLRSVQDRELAQDLTQAVFIMLSKKAKHISNNVLISGWLYKAARYASINAVKNRKLRLEKEEEVLTNTLHIHGINEDRESARQILPLLDQGIDTLRTNYRIAILMKYFEKKSLREIGNTLGITEKAAERVLSKSIGKLRTWFQKRGVAVNGMILHHALSHDMGSLTHSPIDTSFLSSSQSSTGPLTLPSVLAQEGMKIMKTKQVINLLSWTSAAVLTFSYFWVHASLPNQVQKNIPINTSNKTFEAEVNENSFHWLAKRQSEDGSWDSFSHGGYSNDRITPTSLALLAYYGAGYSAKVGPKEFKKTISRGYTWLRKNVSMKLTETIEIDRSMTIALMCLSESSIFGDSSRDLADKLCRKLISAYSEDMRLWEIYGGEEGLSLFTWHVFSLKSSKVAELPFSKSVEFKEHQMKIKAHLFKYYQSLKNTLDQKTASKFLLSLQFLGFERRHAEVKFCAEFLKKQTQSYFNEGPDNIEALYFNTLCSFQYGHQFWQVYHKSFREHSKKRQRRDKSWPAPHLDLSDFSSGGGLVLSTALYTLMNEVYYRYEQFR